MIDDYSGILLIAHGMREEQGRGVFFEIVEHVRQLLPKIPVEGAFLEFAKPTIADAISRLVEQGSSHIAAVPMFLSAFGHTRDDIPRAIAEAVGQLEGSEFRVQGSGGQTFLSGSECKVQDSEVRDQRSEDWISIMPNVGAHQRIVELSALRYRQALEGGKEIPAEETLLIIAAHGSPEPEAFHELAAFAARRIQLTPVGRVEPCFAVLGRPQLAEVLEQSISSSYKRIVVQPHLLLRSRFIDAIRKHVDTFCRQYPEIDWIMTEPLGPDRLLAQAVVESVEI